MPTRSAAQFTLFLTLLMVSPSALAQGLRLGGETSFVFSGWPSFYSSNMQRTVIAQDLYLDNGNCDGCFLLFRASFRLQGDPSISSRDASTYPGMQQVSPILQHAYVLWRPVKFLEIKAGRTMEYDPDAYMSSDGIELRLFLFRGVGLDAYFGMAVRENWPLGFQSPSFQGPPEYSGVPMTLLRVGAFAEGLYGFAGKILYSRAFAGQVEREEVDGSMTVDFYKYLALSFSAEYSIVLKQIDYIQADLAIPINEYTVRAGYKLRKPVFEGSSIFNYFDIYPYDEGRISFGYSSGPLKALLVSYYVRVLSDGTTSAWDNGIDAEIRGRLARHFEGGLYLSYCDGAGGRRSAVQADLVYNVLKWMDLKFNAGGSKFGDDWQKSIEGWTAGAGASTDMALGYGAVLALAADGEWNSLYGWNMYGMASINAMFDIMK